MLKQRCIGVQVDEAVTKHTKKRGPAAGTASIDLSETGLDSLTEGITLQARLNQAVADEDYAMASELRDKIEALKVCCSTAMRPACGTQISCPELVCTAVHRCVKAHPASTTLPVASRWPARTAVASTAVRHVVSAGWNNARHVIVAWPSVWACGKIALYA